MGSIAPQPVLVPSASLHDKVAVVTGSGRGIGRGIAVELAKRGCNVVVNYAKSKSYAEEVVSTIRKLGTGDAIAIQADVRNVSEINQLFEQSVKHFGRIDLVISNSGVESFGRTEDVTEEEYDKVLGLNTRAQFFVGQAAWKYVRDGGRVVLMSSPAAGSLGVKDHAFV